MLRRILAGTGLALERTPPSEVQLWNAGDNPTDYGVHRWTERSIASVMGRYEARGNPLLIDVEHGGELGEDGTPTVTGGYARLELRSGAPWLVFDWSDYAVEQITSGQRRFLSPEYLVDKASGEIVTLTRVSLVADPGTHRARILAAADSNQENRMDLAMILAALTAALSAEDPAVCKESVANLVAELKKSSGGSGDAPPSEGAAEAEAGAAPPAGQAGTEEEQAGAPPAADADKKDESVAATSRKAPAPAPSAGSGAEVVSDAAAKAVAQIRASQRDHLVQTQGDRLEPSLRRWASSQPLEVVEGLLGALPSRESAPVRIAATRGETQGLPVKAKGLEGKELEDVRRSMGVVQASAPEIRDTERGLVIPLITPRALREREAAKAGKAGK